MEPTRPIPVETTVGFRLVAPKTRVYPIQVSLRYEPADPYAVHVLFHPESLGEETISWSFARELFAAGLEEPAGIGDVRVWPWSTPHGNYLALALSSPQDGDALFEVPRAAVVHFLRRTYIQVPRGQESKHIDVDAWLEKLLPSY